MCALVFKKTYAEILAHEGVDDRVDKAVRHRQPVADEVEADEGVVSRLRLVEEDFWVEEDDQHEHLDRKPADDEEDDDQSQHLDHLIKNGQEKKCSFTTNKHVDSSIQSLFV